MRGVGGFRADRLPLVVLFHDERAEQSFRRLRDFLDAYIGLATLRAVLVDIDLSEANDPAPAEFARQLRLEFVPSLVSSPLDPIASFRSHSCGSGVRTGPRGGRALGRVRRVVRQEGRYSRRSYLHDHPGGGSEFVGTRRQRRRQRLRLRDRGGHDRHEPARRPRSRSRGSRPAGCAAEHVAGGEGAAGSRHRLSRSDDARVRLSQSGGMPVVASTDAAFRGSSGSAPGPFADPPKGEAVRRAGMDGRLAERLTRARGIGLGVGLHPDPSEGAAAMELVSWLASGGRTARRRSSRPSRRRGTINGRTRTGTPSVRRFSQG
jgi:hypothetical protein